MAAVEAEGDGGGGEGEVGIKPPFAAARVRDLCRELAWWLVAQRAVTGRGEGAHLRG